MAYGLNRLLPSDFGKRDMTTSELSELLIQQDPSGQRIVIIARDPDQTTGFEYFRGGFDLALYDKDQDQTGLAELTPDLIEQGYTAADVMPPSAESVLVLVPG